MAKTKTETPETLPDITPAALPDPSTPINLTVEGLQTLAAVVAQTVLEALKQSGSLGGGTHADNLGEVIGNAVADGMSKSTRRKVSVGEYLARIRKGRPILTRRIWQNDKEVLEQVLTNDEILLCNDLHRTGRYIDRLVECIIGMDGADEVVYLRYNDKGDHKFALSGAGVRNFKTMLQMINDAQVVEDAAEDEGEPMERQSRGRSFGNGRRTRAAEQAARV